MVGLAAGNQRTTTFIEAAKSYSLQAAQAAQHPPHSAEQWREVEELWEQAIQQVRQVTSADPGYVEAQKMVAMYQTNLGQIRIRRQLEEQSVSALQQAKAQLPSLIAAAGAGADASDVTSRIQKIVLDLEQVKPGTTAYPEAQDLLKSAQNKLNQLQPKS